MTEEARPAPVEADAATLVELRAKLDELGSDQAAAYAMSLGLYPPGYREGAAESLVEFWAAGENADGPGTLVWGSTFPSDEDDDSEDEDGPDPWAAAAPPASRTEGDEDGSDPWEAY